MNETILGRRRKTDGVRRNVRLAAWLVLPALLTLATGCGSSKKPSTTADSSQGQEEEKAAAPAAEAAVPVVKKRGKLIALKTEAPAPAAPSNKDVSKWEMADLDAALARRDLMFMPGVVLFSARGPNDAKRADELAELVRRIAKLKDDPTIPLAMPSAASPVATNAAPAATPAATAPGAQKPPTYKLNFGRKRNNN